MCLQISIELERNTDLEGKEEGRREGGREGGRERERERGDGETEVCERTFTQGIFPPRAPRHTLILPLSPSGFER